MSSRWSIYIGYISEPLIFLIYINDLPEAFNGTGSYLSVDNTCIFYHDKSVEKNRKSLETKFSSLCEWFIDNKSSIHFGNNKAKAIFYSPKKIPSKLNISYGDYSLNVQIIFSPS